LEAATITPRKAGDPKSQLHARIHHDVSAPMGVVREKVVSRVEGERLAVAGLYVCAPAGFRSRVAAFLARQGRPSFRGIQPPQSSSSKIGNRFFP